MDHYVPAFHAHIYESNMNANVIGQKFRRIANKLGFDVHKHSSSNWRWSHDVEDYYPVDPTPRWGHGKPVHPEIQAVLDAQRGAISCLLSELANFRQLLSCIQNGSHDNQWPSWTNGWFRDFDAAALVTFLTARRPNLYFEIGSGNSTKFARFAIDAAKLGTRIVSLDPAPRGEIDEICDEIVRERLERSNLSIFDELAPGDFLFFDGSHRVFPNSDTTVFFLEVLPRLKPGVIVHVHDILLPADYLPLWRKRMYSEQYLLAAMLLSPRPFFKTLLPNYFACTDPELGILVREIIADLPCSPQGWSFWIEKTE